MKRIDLTRAELAINGGTPVRTLPWLDNITTGEEEKQAVIRVMDSGYLSLFEGSHTPDAPFSFKGGPEVQALEDEWSDYYGVKHSISTNSATSGLYAAIGALEIGYGDEVIVSPYTMSACAIAPLIYGAIPVFADVELESGSLDPISIAERVTPRTKAILVVHQFGIPANMDAIMAIAKKHDLKIIEDCAQAHGAKYKEQYVGTIGDIGVFSLNVNKTIQAGEGGVCITNNDDLAYRLQLIRNHGEAVVDAAEYENIVNIAGFNYRLTEIQAAIAREQLKKLDRINSSRIELVEQLIDGISKMPILTPLLSRAECHSTYYVVLIRFSEDIAGITREQFVEAINAEGALFYQGYTKPLYLQPLYQQKILYKNGYPFTAVENKECSMEYNEGACPNAEQLYYKEMLINEHVRFPNMEEDIDDLIVVIKKVLDEGAQCPVK
jgi:perosamine synthetase